MAAVGDPVPRCAPPGRRAGWDTCRASARPTQIFCSARDVRADEGGPRVARHQPLERPQEIVEPREPRAVAEPPVGMFEQFFDALVAFVHRVEERERVTGVDQHGNLHVGGRLPQGRQPGVVGAINAPASSRRCSPRFFQTLSPRAPAAGCFEELCGQPLTEPGAARHLKPVHLGERDEPARVGTVVPVEVGLQLLTAHPVEVHDGGDVGGIHRLEQGGHVGRCPAGREPSPQVVVDVDRGEPRPRHLVLGGAQRRHGPEPAQPKLADILVFGHTVTTTTPASEQLGEQTAIGPGVGDHLMHAIDRADLCERHEADLGAVRHHDDVAGPFDQGQVVCASTSWWVVMPAVGEMPSTPRNTTSRLSPASACSARGPTSS